MTPGLYNMRPKVPPTSAGGGGIEWIALNNNELNGEKEDGDVRGCILF